MAVSGDLGDVKVRFSADTGDVTKGLNDMQGKTSSAAKSITSAFKPIGIAITAAFSVQAISQFIGESVKLAAEAQGVAAAFRQLNGTSLTKLRKATQGTVSDLDLMKAAVKAENFKVPLESLATYFEFATKRSAQTGESVDYLVESIVNGIGRKSSMVLDNLGISATELQTEIKKVGDFGVAAGNIIKRELGNMGDVAQTTAQKMAAITASTENLKASIGNRLLPFVNEFYAGIDRALRRIENFTKTSKDVGAKQGELQWENITAEGRTNTQIVQDFTHQIAAMNTALEKANQTMKSSSLKDGTPMLHLKAKFENAKEEAERLTAAISVMQAQYQTWEGGSKKVSDATAEQTEELEKAKDALKKYEEGLASAQDELKSMHAEQGNSLIMGGSIGFGNLEKTRGIDIPDAMEGRGLDFTDAIDPDFLNFLQEAKVYTDNLNASQEQSQILANVLSDSFNRLGDSILNSLGLADSAFAGFIMNMAQIAIKLIAQQLAISMANSIAGATASGAATGPAAAFTTPGFIAAAIAGVGAAFSSIPKLANGGITTGPTLAMIGEGRENEAIIPLSKLDLMMRKSQMMGIGAMIKNGSYSSGGMIAVLQGQNIYLAGERGNYNQGR